MTSRDIRLTRPCLPLTAVASLILAAAAGAAWAAEPYAQEHGRSIARTYCGGCHALDAGPSPLSAAPPFATLHQRYPRGGGLEDLLAEGMIAPATPQEEGQPRMHPRMPQAHLDEDQVGDLVAFLRAVQRSDLRQPAP